MSLEHIDAGLSPREVVIMRGGGRWRRAARQVQTLRCPAAPQSVPWQPALQLLAQALDAAEVRSARIDVVLSNHFVRYALLPWNAEFVRPAERQALARHRFEQIHGESAAVWRIRLSECGYGAGALACAVDEALVEQLAALCAERRLRLQAVQPYLMVAFNRFRRRIGDSGCFCLVEPGRICLGVFRRGGWEALESRRLPEEIGRSGLEAMLERLLRAAGVSPEVPVFVCGADRLFHEEEASGEAAVPVAGTGTAGPRRADAQAPLWRMLRRHPGPGADVAIALCGAP